MLVGTYVEFYVDSVVPGTKSQLPIAELNLDGTSTFRTSIRFAYNFHEKQETPEWKMPIDDIGFLDNQVRLHQKSTFVLRKHWLSLAT